MPEVLIWTGSVLLIAALGLVLWSVGKYNQVQKELDRQSGCQCPDCLNGGTCAIA